MIYNFRAEYTRAVRDKMLFQAALCFLCLSALFFPLSALSTSQTEQEPIIDEIVISATNGHLLLFATVSNCFTDEMLEGVRNGIPLTFRFDIRLNKIRKNWFDSELVEHKINHTLSYDPLKEEYQVAFAEKERPEVTRSLEEAKQMMADLNGLNLYPLNELHVGSPYSLKIKATLVENTFPLGIHSIIPFTSLWNFETDWRIVEFNY
ncbi:MAG: DUF4390 domain-containing protein [Candidatus Electrothrix communis]|nr:MAG: DUF4390 domain-containing protein [Candidatus Electrothrix communis]